MFRKAMQWIWCGHKGHIKRIDKLWWMCLPSDKFFVAEEIREERTICSVCGEVLSDWKKKHSEGITSLEMTEADWREMREKGRILWS